MDPVHANASDIAALETHAFAPCWVPAFQVPVTRAVAERVPEPARSEKIQRFLIVTIFAGRRIARQPSALRTVVRPDVRLSVGQLVKAGPPPYFGSRRE